MKTTRGRRRLALVLALTLALSLTLAPAAFADDTPALTEISVALDQTSLSLVEGGDDVTLTATATPTPEGAALTGITYKWEVTSGDAVKIDKTDNKAKVTILKAGTATVSVTAKCGDVSSEAATCAVTVEKKKDIQITPTGPITLEERERRTLTASTTPDGETVTWTSSDENVVSVTGGIITAKSPGAAKITAAIGTDKNGDVETVDVEVSGIALDKSSLALGEGERVELPVASQFGTAKGMTLNWSSDNPDVAEIADGRVIAVGPGSTSIKVTAGGFYPKSVSVEVSAGASTIDLTGRAMGVNDTLSFATLKSSFDAQADGKLSHITGLRVDTAQGTLYYKYYSEAEPGSGVAQQGSYYRDPGSGQRGLSDITFVPKPSFAGGTVTISYTAVSSTYENRQCRILLSVEGKSGGTASMSLFTPYDTPVKLSGAEFDRVCQELSGVGVSTVTFSQPSDRQGTLYTNYISPGNYGSVVSTSRSYTRQELDDIWFVPAAGFTGRAAISYTARGRGSAGSVCSGSLTIEVGERSAVKEGGPAYATASGGPVTFDDWDFENYRAKVLSGGNTLSYVRFDSLPSADQGVLYYDYRSAGSPGSQVSAGSSYYYGTRTPRLDRLTFVPSERFTGTVRIPFTGWDRDGRRFSGEVEIAVRGSSGSGDIRYTCAPGRSVGFVNSDFTSLCRELTGRTLNYIVLRELPDRYSEGSLYHNSGSRISSVGTRYYANTSSSNRISRLSFQSVSGFFGSADIPFVGYASNGDSFEGVITISSSGVNDWTIHYRIDSGAAAVFDRDDFDSLSQWNNRENVRSVRFQVPSISEGDLYRNYRSSSNKGTRISSSGTSVSRSGLDQVAFVPAGNYAGTVYINFTATSDDGSVFDGTVEITVERGTTDVPPTTPANFSDVPAGAYYASAVRWAVNNGITTGTSSTTFSPDWSCTVSEIIAFLYRANGSPRVTGSNPFSDVRTSDYYYEAALWARQKGLVSGSYFNPYSPCTRAMVVTYLWKLAGEPVPAARPLNYAPYTLSGRQSYGNFTLRFDAAITAKTRVTLHHDNDEGGRIERDYEPAETHDVTLVAVRPGSRYVIDGGFYGYTYASGDAEWFNAIPASLFFRAGDGSFRYTLTQTGHDSTEFALFGDTLSWFREYGRQESLAGNNLSEDCGALIQLNGEYYFVTYADSAIAAGLLSGSTGFFDVFADAPYAQAVAWATEQKITTGTSKTTFSPDVICSRGQIVTFLYRALAR